MELIKVLEFVDTEVEALTEFADDVRKENYEVYAVDSKLLFTFGTSDPSSQTFIRKVEDHAFSLGLDDSKVKLLTFDSKTGNTQDIQNILEEFAEQNDIEELNEGIPISRIPELLTFIFENEDEIDKKIDIPSPIEKETVTEDKAQEIVLDPVITTESESTNESPEEPSEEDFIDDMVNEDDKVKANLLSSILEPKIKDQDEVKESHESSNESSNNKLDDVDTSDTSKPYPTSNEYLLNQAISLFDRHTHNDLPKFDEVTNRAVQDQILNAQFTVEEARGKGIATIYNRLKSEAEQSKKLIEERVLPSGKKGHESTLTVLERNLAADIEKFVENKEKEYQANKENFVQAQIPILRQKYDAENLEMHQQNLTTAINGLKQDTQKKIQLENEEFSKYIENIFQQNEEKVVSEVSIDDVISEYNHVIQEQRDFLKSYVEAIKEKVEEELNLVTKERDGLKEQLKNLEFEKKEDIEKLKVKITSETENLKKVESDSAKTAATLQKRIEQLERDNELLVQTNHSLKLQSIPRMTLEPENKVEEKTQSKKAKNTTKGYIIGGVCAVLLLIVGVAGGSTLNHINDQLAQEHKIAEQRYTSEKESEEKYNTLSQAFEDNQIKDIKSEISSLQSDIAAHDDTRNRLNEELQEINASQDTDKEQKIADKTQDISTNDKDTEKLKSELEEAQAKLDELTKK